MLIIPAIDLMKGQAVRLAEGDKDRVTVYSDEPWALAEQFARAGAQHIHLVDLDGAFAGAPVQLDLLSRLAAVGKAHGARVDVGGGIRSADTVHRLLELGIDQVVVGTLAVREPAVVEGLCRQYPGKLIIAIDARDGMVAVSGWTETTDVSAAELGKRAEGWGAGALLFTDVARDGLQVGAAVASTAALQREVDIPVIASGGVGTLDDLRELEAAGVRAVVFGRALYEGRFTLEEALAC